MPGTLHSGTPSGRYFSTCSAYAVVLVVGWPIVVLNAYVGYRRIMFRSDGRVLTELPRFFLVYLVTLLANLIILPVALQVLPFKIL